ncbi:MAG: tyrosine-type recombinase/integrase [Sphingomonadaceae bacterium]
MASGKITKRTIDALIASRSEGFLWDDGIKGFGAKITKSGAVSYILQFRMGGREARTRRCTIGSHGSPWTPTTAREEALRLSRLIGQGVDPVEVEKQRRREAVDLAFDNYAQRFERACVGRGWKLLVARSLRIHSMPVLKSKPLPKITRADIVAVFDRMPDTQVANRRNVFAVLRRLFRWTISRGDIDRTPMEGMETPPAVKARDRWLSDEELAMVWKHAPNTHPCFGPIVRLLIVTGQRREEVSSLAWEELDQAERMWILPGDRAKNGEPNRVPLNSLAVSVLEAVAGKPTWPRRGKVFATSTGGGFTGYHKGKEKLDRLIAEDGGEPMQPWRLHDLRRTLATGFQRLGVRFEVTEAVLNHVGGSGDESRQAPPFRLHKQSKYSPPQFRVRSLVLAISLAARAPGRISKIE